MQPKRYNSRGPTNFLKGSYEILSNHSLINIIHWSDTGERFVILDIYNFTNAVLPKYFKHNNLSSFVRQLSMYGFHKHKADSEGVQFSHPMFQRDKKNLLNKIKRKSNDLSIEEALGLTERLQRFQFQQEEMEILLKNMENKYSQVLEQLLISELLQSREKEKYIEQYLQNFAQCTKIEVKIKEPGEDLYELWDVEPVYPDMDMHGEGPENEDEEEVGIYQHDYTGD